MNSTLNKWSRKLHRWGAILVALPLLLVIVTGILLQVKKQVTWVQPPTQRGSGGDWAIDLPQILAISKTVPESGVQGWGDIDRLDLRPERGVVKVRGKNRWELQIDLSDGRILSSTYRRSDFIESLHDGSWFSDGAKLWVFLPNGCVLLGLWGTGVYLWILPTVTRRRNRKLRRSRTENSSSKSDGAAVPGN